MAGTVATDFAFFSGTSGGGSQSDCDATTDWSGSPTLDTDIYVEGTGSLSAKVSKTTYTSVFTFASSVDLSDTILVVYMNCATPGIMDTVANGGLRIRVEDASANWAEWYVGGSDGLSNGFFTVRTNQSSGRTESATPPSYTAITAAGVVCKTTASCAKINFWWDAFRYGSYMQIYAGTAVSPATWDDFLSYEATNVIGVIEEVDSVIFVQCQVQIGSTGAGVDTYFEDTSRAIVFRDREFGTDFYSITGQGNSTGDTRIFFGEKSGTAGISGGTIRSAGTSKYSFDFSDTYIDYLGLYGINFFDADPSSLPTTSSNREVLSCSFESCGELTVSTCTVKYCNFINADAGTGAADGAVLISSTSHNVSYCNFISCPNGWHIDTPGTYACEGNKFTNCAYDIGNDSGALVTISASVLADPSSENNARCFSTYLQAQSYDYNAGAGVYTNEATEARDTAANDMNLLGDADEQEDAYYFGHSTNQFISLDVNIGTNGSGTWTVLWEYYNGSWTPLSGISDGTTGFTAGTGWRSVTWTAPTDWVSTTVNTVSAYWIRARISAFTSKTTAPLGTQAGLIGDVDINNSVNLTVHVEDKDGNNLEDAQCYIQKTTDDEYTSAASGNTQGGTTFTVQESLSSDTPSAGWVRVRTAEYTEQLYRFASVAGKTFTLETKIGPYSCTGGGTGTSLQDTGHDFTSLDIVVGDTVRNETDDSWAVVLEVVDSNNITTTQLQGGSDNTWTSGDNYSVHNLAMAYDGGDNAYVPWMNEVTDSSGDAASVTNYVGSTAITVKVRKYGYKTFRGSGTSTADGFSTDIILASEPNVGL